MSGGEFFVVAIGLSLGYLVVSMLMGGKKNMGEQPRSAEPPTFDSVNEAGTSDAQRAEAERREWADDSSWNHVLGVSRQASEEEIRAAYRRLMSQYHPDKVAALGQELRDLAERKSKEIGAAYAMAMQARGYE